MEDLVATDKFPDYCEPRTKVLTIKTAGNSAGNEEKFAPVSPFISISPHLNSPSPPSSAFVSALQSPYISPRATELQQLLPPESCCSGVPSATIPSPTSYSGSHSDDLPSISYTPPSEGYDFPSDAVEQRPKFSDTAAAPRISFSFPLPRVSFTKNSVSPSGNAKLRSCDVYIGFHGHDLNLIRFCKWLKSELELQGIASFVADRSKYSDAQSHEIADRILCSAAFGVVVVTPSSFGNHLSIEEIRFFAQKKNLIPLLFDAEISEIMDGRLDDKECREAFEGIVKCNEHKLEANDSNWRNCISRVVGILKSKIGRKIVAVEEEAEVFEELPFPRNRHFVGREKELAEMEVAFFGCSDGHETACPKPLLVNGGSSDGFADEESDATRTGGRYISFDLRKCKEPTLESWADPVIELTGKGRSLQKQRSKNKKSRGSTGSKSANVFCINGASGAGKTELALEFAYRYVQRYKMVLWVGGEARYFRQNILNLALNLGLDVSAEAERERGRIRGFDEQELDAFQRVKRELFREVPYLLVIDNLESEKEWWDGKDLHELIPKNTGATHVIITTRLSKVMNFDPMQLPEISLEDSLFLMKGRSKKDYSAEELNVLKKFDERLRRLSFGLSLVGSLLSEMPIPPSELFDAIQMISLNDTGFSLGGGHDDFWLNNSFLVKVLVFCFVILDRSEGRNLASRMALSGAWFASAPVSSTLLAAAANSLPTKGGSFQQWGRGLSIAFCCGARCCLAPHARKNEVESALMLVKLGLARRATRQPGFWIQFHPITQMFAKRRDGLASVKATVDAVRKIGNVAMNSDHLWASAFLVFGFKSEPPLVQLKAVDMVLFIKRTAIPLAIRSFMIFSRCNSALELLKVCTTILEEVEKSFVSQTQDLHQGSLCWKKKKLQPNNKVDEYVWQDVTLLKATLLETRAKLLLRGGYFDNGEDLCRTCISIRTVILGHNHAQTLAAQETLSKLVRYRSKI